MDREVLEFIKESNKIEAIVNYDESEQYDAYQKFMHLDAITIENIESFAFRLYQTSFGKQNDAPVIRRKKGQNVRVGTHRPIPGGPEVENRLKVLLNQINNQEDSGNAYDVHRRYETLHPLTDCNGRTGRAIWAWLMLKDNYNFGLGFLHKWYRNHPLTDITFL